jgi:hypothetical protein
MKISQIIFFLLLFGLLTWCTNKYTHLTESWNTNTGIIIQSWSIDNTWWISDYPQTFSVNLSEPEHSLSFLLNTWENITLLVKQPSVKAAIRVSQIIMPDWTMDGPFWSELIFIAKQKWIYKFIISVNQMASEEIFTGSVMIKTETTHTLIE